MKRKLPPLPPVSTFTVAPHRYLWNDPPGQDVDESSWRAVRDAAPYKAGEVVYVVHGDGYRLAYIVRVDARKNLYDDWQECYEVRPANKSGDVFAARSYTAYPGFIQRAYKRAGLAPEIPASEMA
jgi:hypothetical protein